MEADRTMFEKYHDRLDWVYDQFEAGHVPEDTSKRVLKLLDLLWDLEIREDDVREVVRVFGLLAQGHALVAESPDEVWQDVRPGNIYVRDTVRVKADQFTGRTGTTHNGRRGTVVAIRGGDVVVRYENAPPGDLGTHHSPYALQKRIR